MIVLLARHYVKGGPGYRRREIARGKTARRHTPARGSERETCRARNQRVSCVILTPGGRKKVGAKSADGATLSFCTNYFLDFCHEKNEAR